MEIFRDFDLEGWLEARSTSKKFINGELVYSHKDNTTSVLVPRCEEDDSLDSILIESPLSWFYKKYTCASVGDSHVILASSKHGGIGISQGYKVPDRQEMTDTLKGLNVVGQEEDYFIGVEAAWMFAYGVRGSGDQCRLIRFDRDMQTTEEVQSIESVFEDWWSLVCEDS